MTLARVRRPSCEARPAAWKASPSTYTPPWKYRTTWRGSVPATVISATGTAPSVAAVTVTSAGSGTADVSSRSSRRCSPTSLSAGNADCRRTASRVSRCSVLTEHLPFGGIDSAAAPSRLIRVHSLHFLPGGVHVQPRRRSGKEASPDHGDFRDGPPLTTSVGSVISAAAIQRSATSGSRNHRIQAITAHLDAPKPERT